MDTAAVALATFFATIGPLDVAAIFAALTVADEPARRRSLAVKFFFDGIEQSGLLGNA